ncbi:MAG: hypothetical protein EP329_26390 [Deltaproteobacteria bacterium]|nr:MAG: hypothetical protein EP329_26390 [Deltaproteobacteria bacterium]
MTGRWPLPSTWEWARVGDLGDVVGGGTPHAANPENFSDSGVPWLTPADLAKYSGATISRGTRDLSERGLATSSARLLPPGAVLFTSRAPIGYCAVAANPIATNQGFKSIVLAPGVDPFFLRQYLLSAKEYAEQQASGTTFLELSGTRMKELLAPLPPLNEQKRIVAKLEAVQARSDAAKAALDAIPPLLDKFRQSVLAAAFRGDLTRAWRAAHPDVEPASALLARIRAERRRRWEEAHPGKRYKEPEPVDASDLPELPAGWCWASMDEVVVAGPQNGVYIPRSQYGPGMPILRVDDYQLQWSRSSEELQQVAVPPESLAKYQVSVGDLVINRVNSPSHLGKVLLVEARHTPAVFESNMMRVTLSAELHPSLIRDYLASEAGKRYLTSNAKWAVNQASINQGDVGRTPIPLPPVAEQTQITSATAESLSALDRLSASQDVLRRLSQVLNQSILAKAFRGELVPQDPDDEPASALLERLRAARAASPKKGRRKG